MSERWQAALAEHWGVTGTLTRLDGEYDLNFLVTGETEYVLKVMRPGCPEPFIDMQARVLEHLGQTAPDLPVPGVIPTLGGSLTASLQDETGAPRIAWMLQKLPGRTYANHRPHDAALIHDLGRAVGAMDRGMEGFRHPELERDFKWNLMQAGWISDELDAITNPERRALVDEIASEFRQVLPDLQALPRQAIHNDVNDYNILVTGALDQPAAISGLIDFGDMCAGPKIVNLAITAAYIVLGHEDPETALQSLVAGLSRRQPADRCRDRSALAAPARPPCGERGEFHADGGGQPG